MSGAVAAARRRTGWLLGVALLAAGCAGGEGGGEVGADPGPGAPSQPPVTASGEIADAGALPHEVFQREDAGEGRMLLRVIVASARSADSLRATFQTLFEQEADARPEATAFRAVAYLALRADEGAEADLVSVAWAEWLPPQGWDEASGGTPRDRYRQTMYVGVEPPWAGN